jgi:hypothetical protein
MNLESLIHIHNLSVGQDVRGLRAEGGFNFAAYNLRHVPMLRGKLFEMLELAVQIGVEPSGSRNGILSDRLLFLPNAGVQAHDIKPLVTRGFNPLVGLKGSHLEIIWSAMFLTPAGRCLPFSAILPLLRSGKAIPLSAPAGLGATASVNVTAAPKIIARDRAVSRAIRSRDQKIGLVVAQNHFT